MRNDVPAALPLIGLIFGLATHFRVREAVAFAAIAVLCLVIRHVRAGTLVLFIALGIMLALRVESREHNERTQLAAFDPDRFAIVEAPLQHDWSPRGTSFVLRAARFIANGVVVDAPIAIYARFEPPEVAMERSVRVEGFLRISDDGRYTATVKSPELMTYEGTLPRWHPAAWNRALANRLEQHADLYPTEVALAQALVLGRGERLDQSLRDSFRRGGTYHLLVFSGLQIAFAAALLAALLRWLHKPRASDWLLLAFAVLAPLFIGPTASVSRASTGIGLYAISRLARRPTSLENLWCVAALTRLILEPRDLTDPSFHLTYAGAGALVFIGAHLGGRRWLGCVVAAEVTMTPLTLFHFHQYALGGALLTLVMAPVIFAMLIVSLLACAFPTAAVFGTIGVLHRVCAVLNLAGVAGTFASPPLPALVAGAILTMLAIATLTARKRAIAISVALLIPTTAAVVKFVSARHVENPRITFLDIGQGDAIALRSGRRTMLVDGGPDPRVVALLADRGVRTIDDAVLTHAHPDHCNGLLAAVEQLNVRRMWISPRAFRGDCAVQLLEACRVTATPIHLLRDGAQLSLADFDLAVHIADRTFRRAPENNASVVLHVQTQGRRVLLTGDIEREAEIHFDDRDLRADVLKVAHHGSRSSTAGRFLDATAPRLAVVSCGRRNPFGHPHPSVLGALAERRIRVWRTDRDGSVDLDVRDGKLYVHARKD